ncbi:hypothetical protein VaNZ11_000340 [Volvox africanus]|uniref:Uncharacterized protein n=1 Tax=Volvox africanus TaxID=51714 RepID=A0ABQ5RMH5_9CHLO|nr:hypothetical protein VaNZ11_000340 [Volvox africanus]
MLHGLIGQGYWSAEDYFVHINWKELRAVCHALGSFLPYVCQCVLPIKDDNTCTQAVLGHLSSRSPRMHEELQCLWNFLQQFYRLSVWLVRIMKQTQPRIGLIGMVIICVHSSSV